MKKLEFLFICKVKMAKRLFPFEMGTDGITFERIRVFPKELGTVFCSQKLGK